MLQFLDSTLQGFHNRCAVGLDNPVDQHRDLTIDLDNLPLHDDLALGARAHLRVPQIAEHRGSQIEKFARRCHRPQEVFKSLFDLRSGDRFATAGAFSLAAQIIGVGGARSFRPIGRHGLAAVIASYEASQREIGCHIDARRCAQAAVEPFLDTVVRVEADQGLMLGLAQADIPARYLQIARIERLSQKLVDALIQYDAMTACRELGMRFEEALHSGPAVEPAAGIAFERFADDRGERFLGHDHLSAARRPRVAIGDRRLEHPIAVERPRPHPVHRLLAILLTLMLGDAGEKMLDELAIGVLAELDRRRLEDSSRAGNLGPEFQMGFQPARKTADVVDDDDMLPFRLERRWASMAFMPGRPTTPPDTSSLKTFTTS